MARATRRQDGTRRDRDMVIFGVEAHLTGLKPTKMLIEDYYKMKIFCGRITIAVANIGSSRFKLLSKRWRQRRQLPRAG